MQIGDLYKIFGNNPDQAFDMLEQGLGKDEIMEKTGIGVGLADVNFDVYEGEILVVMGLSGSGKSTLIRCLNRLVEPTRGSITLDGENVLELDSEGLRQLRQKKFSMVFQHFALFPHRTVLQNAEFGLEIQGIDPETRKQKAMEALSQVGLGGWEHSYPEQLSGGMQQRVGLARGLAVDADVMLMDEAFSALDPLIRRDMQHELVALQDRIKKTIVFITHDLDEALEIGDRIILMKDGRIVQIGTAEEILTKPADEYVRRFVEDVDFSKVLGARSVMVKPKTVAYPKDGPHTAVHKMREQGISSIFVIKRDETLLGLVTAQDASEASKRGETTIENLIIQDIPTAQEDEHVHNLLGRMAEANLPMAVVDDKHHLLGVVVRGALLGALAEASSEGGNE